MQMTLCYWLRKKGCYGGIIERLTENGRWCAMENNVEKIWCAMEDNVEKI